jgi:hypothetical protein
MKKNIKKKIYFRPTDSKSPHFPQHLWKGFWVRTSHTFVWTVNLTLSFSLSASEISMTNEESVDKSTDVVPSSF